MNKKNISIFLSVLICSIIFSLLSYLLYTDIKSLYYIKMENNPFHAKVDKTLDYEEIKEIENLKGIKSIGLRENPISAKIDGNIISLTNENEKYLDKHKNSFLIEGENPKNDNEIILSYDLKEKLNLEIGDTIKLDLGDRLYNGDIINPNSTKTQNVGFEVIDSKDYKITGFTIDTFSANSGISSGNSLISDYNGKYILSMDFDNIFKAYDIKYDLLNYIDENLNSDIDIEMNTVLLNFFGVSENGFFVSRVLLEAIAFLGVLLVLVLMIKNIFNIWAIYKIKELSMYKSIGATDFQIYKLLLRDSLLISILPMIIGQFIGFNLTKFIYNYITDIKNLVSEVSISFEYSIIVSLIIFLLTFITILLAIISPARKIAKINIIEGLKGNLNFKEYKKKRGKTLFRELNLNNRRTLKSQVYVMVAGILIIMAMLDLVSISTANNNYFNSETDYNLIVNYSKENGEYPKIFDEILDSIEFEKSFIFGETGIDLDFSNLELSEEFGSIGFNNRFIPKEWIENKLLDGKVYGYDNKTFNEIGGKDNEILLLNTVQKNPLDDIYKSEKIPFFKNVEEIRYKYKDGESLYNLNIDKNISNLGDYGEILYPYTVSMITSMDNLKNIIDVKETEYNELNNSKPITSFYLNMKVTQSNLNEISENIDSIIKNNIEYDSSYSIYKEEAELEERASQIMPLFSTILAIVVILLNTANSYSTTNLSFFNRRIEIGTLLSCGMEVDVLEKSLKREIIIQMIKATLISGLLNIVFILLLSNINPITTFTKILQNIRYDILIIALIIIFLTSYIIYLFAMRKLTRKDVIELIKTL